LLQSFFPEQKNTNENDYNILEYNFIITCATRVRLDKTRVKCTKLLLIQLFNFYYVFCREYDDTPQFRVNNINNNNDITSDQI